MCELQPEQLVLMFFLNFCKMVDSCLILCNQINAPEIVKLRPFIPSKEKCKSAASRFFNVADARSVT